MKAAEDNAATLQEHMTRTYLNLRLGIAIIGAALPLLLWIGGAITEHKALLDSMSAYYYTPMRDTFVGALVSVGVFLYLYKGFSTKENWALNLAGMFAVGIAMVATTAPDGEQSVRSTLHNIFAVLFFFCIAYVAMFRAADTLSLIANRDRAKKLQGVYRAFGVTMAVSPIVAVVISYVAEPRSRGRSSTFFIEMLAVWTFAAYWIVKSMEISATDAERLALAGKIEAAPELKEAKEVGHFVRVK
jgi:hypothetical protein